MTTGADNPWHFGANDQYPVLQFDRDARAVDRQRASASMDYDANDNNLIDITTLAQLNAIRHNLNGNAAGIASGHYATAFTGLSAGIGCPAACAGCELLNDLDFDTSGSDGIADAPYANWTPMGTDAAPFSSTFQGNNNAIANLNVNAGASVITVGLFGSVTGAVSGVGLSNARVAGARNNLAMGALVASLGSTGTVTSSWVTVSVTSSNAGASAKYVGGMVGFAVGRVRASYVGASVTAANAATNARVGGLVGQLNGGRVTASYAAGAVSGGAVITASYATGMVAPGAGNRGGLTGTLLNGARDPHSYWDVTTTGIADDTNDNAPEGKTPGQLHRPDAYAGIYANWDLNLDGVTGNDDPWEFGTVERYPVLKYGGLDTAAQFSLQPVIAALSTLTVAPATLSPAFDPETLAYAAALPDSFTAPTVTVNALPVASTTTVAISAVAGGGAPRYCRR